MRALNLALTALVLTVAVACDGSDSPAGPTGAAGQFRLMLTDSPFSEAEAVLVTFSAVTVHRTGGAFVTLPFADGESARTCDLKKLQDAIDALGVGDLDEGHYTQVRVTVERATLYFDDDSDGAPCAPSIPAPGGRSADVVIPSGIVRLNREFDVTGDGPVTMLVDLDGDRSIRQTGKGRYMMQPVLAVVSVEN
jgi:hypothetical protein